MNELTVMQSFPIERKEYNGAPVVTFRDIDAIHQKPEGTAKRNFNQNKKHFVEGVDYYKLSASELYENRTVGIQSNNGGYIFTQTGYLMIVKSFSDDLSWAIQRELVNGYFARQQQGLTFMGTPVIPLSEAAKALGLSKEAAAHRISSRKLGMADAILLEGRNLARFKQENNIKLQVKAIWMVSLSGFDRLRQG